MPNKVQQRVHKVRREKSIEELELEKLRLEVRAMRPDWRFAWEVVKTFAIWAGALISILGTLHTINRAISAQAETRFDLGVESFLGSHPEVGALLLEQQLEPAATTWLSRSLETGFGAVPGFRDLTLEILVAAIDGEAAEVDLRRALAAAGVLERSKVEGSTEQLEHLARCLDSIILRLDTFISGDSCDQGSWNQARRLRDLAGRLARLGDPQEKMGELGNIDDYLSERQDRCDQEKRK